MRWSPRVKNQGHASSIKRRYKIGEDQIAENRLKMGTGSAGRRACPHFCFRLKIGELRAISRWPSDERNGHLGWVPVKAGAEGI
jgi:hypothetical protein